MVGSDRRFSEGDLQSSRRKQVRLASLGVRNRYSTVEVKLRSLSSDSGASNGNGMDRRMSSTYGNINIAGLTIVIGHVVGSGPG